ncbi:spore germination protein [Paenibacillus flagellatus]|uniref:Spore germination protein n=1 Tax=Paenibacillus flagellatus TaxID=2211139 RepID=A0A2V5JYN6_9BACL|nr:spore germination protein [Paenibacillus flagellatus]PYI51928.1 spore germination protein [Paenibacillus flagellatus]
MWFRQGGAVGPKPRFRADVRDSPAFVEPPERPGWFRDRLAHCSDVYFHEIALSDTVSGVIVYIEEIVDMKVLREQLLRPIADGLPAESVASADALRKAIPVPAAHTTPDCRKTLLAVLNGAVAIMAEPYDELVVVPLRAVKKRPVGETVSENVIRGPKEAFAEDLATNLSLVRKRIKHPDLKMESVELGAYTGTDVAILYIEGLCRKELVDELRRRMSLIDIDGVLGSSYVEEFIEDNPFSPFPQVQYTERPDTTAAALLEGRIAVVVDGTPMALLVPVTLYMLLQSAEDYYQRYMAATWIRWIRYLFLLVSFLLPSLYVAITTFHPEMLPPNLLLTVAAARENVPFPAIVEAFLMELTFEALREAGLRIPKPIGQTVSIIGALVLGQAAIEAGIVSSPMLIVVSITGIASFIIPHFDLGLTFRLLRFPIMVLAGSFGLFGIMIGIFLIYLHLVTLRSFGTPYLTPTAPLRFGDFKDVLVRAPWWLMKKRPVLYGNANRQRMSVRKRTESDPTED